jgi:hypothetical protein
MRASPHWFEPASLKTPALVPLRAKSVEEVKRVLFLQETRSEASRYFWIFVYFAETQERFDVAEESALIYQLSEKVTLVRKRTREG